MMYVRRNGRSLFVFHKPSTLGVTVWRRGALSLQLRGRFLQVVFGDWWMAT